MTGGFVLVVGPSGAGKDTLIGLAKRALAGDERFVFPTRVVTRPKSEWEDHDSLDPASFERAEAAGRHCLSWGAHGLRYGIPAQALAETRLGRTVVCNVSRAVIEAARRRLPAVAVVEITAPSELLLERLATRRRGEDGDIAKRVLRSRAVGETRADLRIVNDRRPEEGAAMLVAFLRDRAEAACPMRQRSEAGGRES